MRKSNHPIDNRTSGLPAYSAVPHLTVPKCAPLQISVLVLDAGLCYTFSSFVCPANIVTCLDKWWCQKTNSWSEQQISRHLFDYTIYVYTRTCPDTIQSSQYFILKHNFNIILYSILKFLNFIFCFRVSDKFPANFYLTLAVCMFLFSNLYWPIALVFISKGEGKAIPLQAWKGPENSRRLRLPDFMTIGT
jgi:hypothetical protein